LIATKVMLQIINIFLDQELMLEEVHKLCDMLEQELEMTQVNADGECLMELALKMNISIVNALWVLLVGEKLELNDERLTTIVKVKEVLAIFHLPIHIFIKLLKHAFM
jgi:hypothetical protein